MSVILLQVKGLPANQGTLYKQDVEDMFRKCDVNPKAYFEETRYSQNYSGAILEPHKNDSPLQSQASIKPLVR